MTCCRLLIATVCWLVISASSMGLAAEGGPKLGVVDRSESKDGLYHCTVLIPKDLPVQTVGIELYDRQKAKMGSLVLEVFDTWPDQRAVPFTLSHELIKNSVVVVEIHPPDDERHEFVKLVIGDRPALRKRDGKTIEVPIE